MNTYLEQLKQAALAAMNEPWAFPDGDNAILQYASVANPAIVLALIERLEQAEALPVAADKDATTYERVGAFMKIKQFGGSTVWEQAAGEFEGDYEMVDLYRRAAAQSKEPK